MKSGRHGATPTLEEVVVDEDIVRDRFRRRRVIDEVAMLNVKMTSLR